MSSGTTDFSRVSMTALHNSINPSLSKPIVRYISLVQRPSSIKKFVSGYSEMKATIYCEQCVLRFIFILGDRKLIDNSVTQYCKATTDTQELHPSNMSLTKSTFAIISQAFRVPSSYLYLRTNANASGAHTKHCQRNELGKVTSIGTYQTAMNMKLNEVSSDNSCTSFPSERIQVHMVNIAILGSHAKFDGHLLRRLYRIRPTRARDLYIQNRQYVSAPLRVPGFSRRAP